MLYSGSIHYRTPQGEWTDSDNTWSTTGSPDTAFAAGRIATPPTCPPGIGYVPVCFELDNHWVSFRLNGAREQELRPDRKSLTTTCSRASTCNILPSMRRSKRSSFSSLLKPLQASATTSRRAPRSPPQQRGRRHRLSRLERQRCFFARCPDRVRFGLAGAIPRVAERLFAHSHTGWPRAQPRHRSHLAPRAGARLSDHARPHGRVPQGLLHRQRGACRHHLCTHNQLDVGYNGTNKKRALNPCRHPRVPQRVAHAAADVDFVHRKTPARRMRGG